MSTASIEKEPPTAVPNHVAVIMDGNGRWARRRRLPRHAGHRAGVRAARRTVRVCAEAGVRFLTLFAFSSENWNRSHDEVGKLMRLFVEALESELAELERNRVRVRFIGDLDRLSATLRERIMGAERRTASNDGMTLIIAVAYGGRWDIVQAARRTAQSVAEGSLSAEQVDEASLAQHLCLSAFPEPDLLIRTGGEHRISNFLLWDLAYAELYFCDALWPQFDAEQLTAAFKFFAQRERRFGRTGEQLEAV